MNTIQYTALIVEDDLDIANLLKESLLELNVQTVTQSDGKLALHHALNHHYDLILLDVMLPNLSGLEICKSLRDKKPDQSIIMITSKDSELDRVLGLELGADDYINKPFSILELQARVKSQLRKVERFRTIQHEGDQKKNCIKLDGFYLDFKKREVIVDDVKLELTSTEFDLLHFFAKSPGQVFSRTELLDKVWDCQFSGYEHTVNTHINRLRSKIEPNASQPKWIHTVWGIGYKFYQEE